MAAHPVNYVTFGNYGNEYWNHYLKSDNQVQGSHDPGQLWSPTVDVCNPCCISLIPGKPQQIQIAIAHNSGECTG